MKPRLQVCVPTFVSASTTPVPQAQATEVTVQCRVVGIAWGQHSARALAALEADLREELEITEDDEPLGRADAGGVGGGDGEMTGETEGERNSEALDELLDDGDAPGVGGGGGMGGGEIEGTIGLTNPGERNGDNEDELDGDGRTGGGEGGGLGEIDTTSDGPAGESETCAGDGRRDSELLDELASDDPTTGGVGGGLGDAEGETTRLASLGKIEDDDDTTGDGTGTSEGEVGGCAPPQHARDRT